MKTRIFALMLLLPLTSFAATLHFIALSDPHLNQNKFLSMDIDPAKASLFNDLDLEHFHQIIQKIVQDTGPGKALQPPDFILLQGDLVGHRLINWGRKEFVLSNATAVLKTLKNAYPKTPIIYLFGNNDAIGENYGPFTHNRLSVAKASESAGFRDPFLSTGALCKAGDAPPCLLSQNTHLGFFSIKIAPKLRLLGLNSVMFSIHHQAKNRSVSQQFKFLRSELERAKKQGDSVLIAMHIPVGKNIYDGSKFWKDEYANTFLSLLDKYPHYVKGVLVSHTHMEQLQPIELSWGTIGQYYTAGLSTSHGNSPSLKQYDLSKDKSGWVISDYQAWGIHQRQQKLSLDLSYRFQETFCPTGNKTVILDINHCLDRITLKTILPFITQHNPNHSHYKIKAPDAFRIKISH